MVEAICGAISPGQYHFRYWPAVAAYKFPNFSNNIHAIKGTKSSVSITTWLLTLWIGKSNARALRAWALPIPSIGSITKLLWTPRVLFLLYESEAKIVGRIYVMCWSFKKVKMKNIYLIRYRYHSQNNLLRDNILCLIQISLIDALYLKKKVYIHV